MLPFFFFLLPSRHCQEDVGFFWLHSAWVFKGLLVFKLYTSRFLSQSSQDPSEDPTNQISQSSVYRILCPGKHHCQSTQEVGYLCMISKHYLVFETYALIPKGLFFFTFLNWRREKSNSPCAFLTLGKSLKKEKTI